MYSYKIIIKENFIFYNNANRKTIITVPLLNLCMRILDPSMAIGKNGENVMWEFCHFVYLRDKLYNTEQMVIMKIPLLFAYIFSILLVRLNISIYVTQISPCSCAKTTLDSIAYNLPFKSFPKHVEYNM